MGYWFLAVSLLSGAVKGYCGKRLGAAPANIQSSVLLNFVRMLLCVLFGIVVLFALGDAPALTLLLPVLLISAISGISTAFFVVSWLFSVKRSAYMLLDVFLMLGTLVPMVLGRVLFSEAVSLRQWIGFGILLLATLVMCSYQSSVKRRLSPASLLLLLSCGLANGVTDFSQKLFVKEFPDLPVSVFNLYTYIFAAIALALVFVFLQRKEKPRFENSSAKTRFLYLLMMAVALACNSYFKTLAASSLDSARLYPFNQGIALTLSTLMATFFFKEKFTFQAFAGILLAFIALLMMNL